MGKMFDHYRSMFGEAVKGGENAMHLNGPCPFCGGEDRFTLRAESTEKLGEMCEKHGFKEFFWCRQCQKGGDVIAFLMEACGMTFAEARAKALETVAIPNTSEHQLGLSVDLVGKSINDWLAVHCWEYGFILRYPEGKQHITGITNEPWHFRYVGTAVSMDMKDSGLCLEEYLGADPVTREGIDAVHGDKWHREEFYTVDEETIAKYTKQEETEKTPPIE